MASVRDLNIRELTVKKLTQLAKKRGLKGYSKKNKSELKPLKGSSYIPLPSCLASKKAIINMQNEDEECFKWSITRAWYYTSPGLAWDAMLKRTGISLELLTDIDMLLMFKDTWRCSSYGIKPPRSSKQ